MDINLINIIAGLLTFGLIVGYIAIKFKIIKTKFKENISQMNNEMLNAVVKGLILVIVVLFIFRITCQILFVAGVL